MATTVFETEAFKRAEAAVRKRNKKKDRYAWVITFKTTGGYTPACEAMIAIETINSRVCSDDLQPVSIRDWKLNRIEEFFDNEIAFTADDDVANSVMLAVKASSIPNTGHLIRKELVKVATSQSK